MSGNFGPTQMWQPCLCDHCPKSTTFEFALSIMAVIHVNMISLVLLTYSYIK